MEKLYCVPDISDCFLQSIIIHPSSLQKAIWNIWQKNPFFATQYSFSIVKYISSNWLLSVLAMTLKVVGLWFLTKEIQMPKLPLGADKTHDASKGVFSVFSNGKSKNYDTIWSGWEFAKNLEQPQVCRLIRLEVTVFQSEDGKRWAAKMDLSNQPPRRTAMRMTTFLCSKVSKMEEKVNLSLDCGISQKTDLD